MLNTITSYLKKDDNARLLQDTNGELYLETLMSQEELEAEQQLSVTERIRNHMLNEDAVGESVVGVVSDVRVQSIFYMFLANAGMHLVIFLLAMQCMWIFWDTNHTSLIILICIWSVALLFVYVALCLARPAWYTWVLLGIFSLAMSVVLACAAVMTHHTAILLWTLVSLLQSLSMVVYAKVSPRNIVTAWAVFIMFIVTILVWGISIVGFVTDGEWVIGLIVFGASVFTLLYHAWQISIIEARYSLSASDIQMSLVNMYCDPVKSVCCKLCSK